ncbi:hypothetical protein PF005_g17137 [Phytophthora fragariae]|uniref:Anaphase-promoting complex subunit 4 WD40 domain-containing protein n=1 Tax=Phytophthora fragariae TaxID=53985 RepID=A0A6A3X4F5_9STRA|nr:hypothetical protein PF005_g17137 [Phytophthora fragariae]KAE9211691.1 hypothetical protein PF002_g18453 [Phytophthora fragariae]
MSLYRGKCNPPIRNQNSLSLIGLTVAAWATELPRRGQISTPKHVESVLPEIVKHPSNDPFSQVSWKADGSLLAAFGKGSRSVIVFDAIFSRETELQSPYKLSTLPWSPTGEYLFVTTENGVSFMWETLTRKSETWEIAAGVCSKRSEERHCRSGVCY